jgi:hypothetical protein
LAGPSHLRSIDDVAVGGGTASQCRAMHQRPFALAMII